MEADQLPTQRECIQITIYRFYMTLCYDYKVIDLVKSISSSPLEYISCYFVDVFAKNSQ